MLGSRVWFLKGDFLSEERGWGGGAHLVPSCLQSMPGFLHCPPHAGGQQDVAVGVVVPDSQGSGAGVHLEQRHQMGNPAPNGIAVKIL